MDVVYEGTFSKEGSWVRSWKKRYFEIVKDGRIVYKEEKTSTVINGIFDISGRLDCSRYTDRGLFPDGEGLIIKSTSTGRQFKMMFDSITKYQEFCIGIARVARFHNLYKLAMEENWSELFLEGTYNDEEEFLPDENEDYNNSDDSSGDEGDSGGVADEQSETADNASNDNFKSQLEISSSSMSSVTIRDCQLSMSDIDKLVKVYLESKKKTLDVAGCHLTAAGISKIMLALTRSAKNLTMLNLNDNSAKQIGCANIGSFLAGNKTLVELNLYGNFIGDAGALQIAKGLDSNSTLERLFLGNNGIGKDGCGHLCGSLTANKCIRVLDLSENAIGLGGSIKLSSLLMENKSILVLNVSYQTKKIGPEGAILFSKVLRQPTSRLTSLLMARNRIGFEGCRHIAGALLVNKTLTELDISGANFITMEGSMQLAQAMSFNTTLIWLGIGDHRLNLLELRGIMPSAEGSTGELSRKSSLCGSPPKETKKKQHRGSQVRDLVLLSAQKKLQDEIMMQGPRLVCFIPPKVPAIEAKYKVNNCCDWSSLLDEISAPKNFTETVNGESNELIVHYWGIYINPNQKKYNFGSLDTTNKDTMVCLDDSAVVMASLLRPNAKHFCLNLSNGFLPLQHLLGSDLCQPEHAISLDLSFRCIKSADAIVIGGLLSENVLAEKVLLKGNSFAGTEGENWIVYGLTRNVNLGLDESWPPQYMYVDGYKALAAAKGTSASGLAIEPQRLDTYGWQFVAIGGCCMFYTGIAADILTILIYDNNPEYYRSWVLLGSFFLCLPTFLIVMITATTIGPNDPMAALKTCLLEMSQLPRFLEVLKSVTKGMETAALLDHQFMYTVFKAVPQVVLQLYITFIVAIEDGTYSLVVMGASAISLCVISSMMVLLYDRKQIRLMSMAQASCNPWCTRMLASVLNKIGIGGSDNTEGVQELVDYDSFYASNYVWCIISYLTIIPARAICITWLLAVAGREIYVVFITVLGIRMTALYFLENGQNVANRPWFRFCLQALSLTISDSAWKKDDLNPIESFNCFIILSILTTLENVFAVAWAAFLTQERGIESRHSSGLYFFGFCVMILRWVLIVNWVIPVHYPELMSYNDGDMVEEEPLLEDEKELDRQHHSKRESHSTRISFNKPGLTRLGSQTFVNSEVMTESDAADLVSRARKSTSINANGEVSYGVKLRRASMAAPTIRRGSTAVKNIGWTPPNNRKSYYNMRRQKQKSSTNVGGDGSGDEKSSAPKKSVGFSTGADEVRASAEEVNEGAVLRPIGERKRATGFTRPSFLNYFTSKNEAAQEGDVEMGMASSVTVVANQRPARRGSVLDYVMTATSDTRRHGEPRRKRLSIFGEAAAPESDFIDVDALCMAANQIPRNSDVSSSSSSSATVDTTSLTRNPLKSLDGVPIGRLLFVGPFEKKGPTTYSPWQLRLLIITSYSVDYYWSSYMDAYTSASEGNKSAFATSMGVFGSKTQFMAVAKILDKIRADCQDFDNIRQSRFRSPGSGIVEVEKMLKVKGYKRKGSIPLSSLINVAAVTEARFVHNVDFAVETRVYHFRTDDAILKAGTDDALAVIARIQDP